ncbi:MAG TPA: transcriptional regulator [Cryomorphaceae bacterium]|nr:transcriptional regulator [Owenweeksia sp.]MBF97825.1 transcriptional regulator [Owenweeksia sp.]HAD96760.1 transcriptional regulator [Cryomorphaceae bacterium]HBF21514.1 transcriptional regulator [Cryomorphaceae bacterium]HCQ15503.1 transcriptional regulator [Cryomorphaceae bacterium]|tara:strand:+ start:861 stop:1340 length:480 start_codon:yes stop_codon:yes gene_type:complete
MAYEIDKIDRQILTLLIEDARMPYTDIAKKINVSAGTVHGRVKKMERRRLITGATLTVDYNVVGYSFTANVGLILSRTLDSEKVIKELVKIPEITVANLSTGKFSIFCKIRCRDTKHAREVIFKINSIPGVMRTESMISLDEPINDKKRLFRSIFDLPD